MSAGELLRQANQLKRSGKLDEAIVKYRQAIKLSGSCSYILYYELGDGLAKKGLFDEAILSFKKSIELNPNSALSYYRLSEVLLTYNKFSSSSEYYEYYQKAIHLNPNLSNYSKKMNKLVYSDLKDNLDMKFTGERYVPHIQGQIRYEHLHRYGLCLEIVRGKSVLDIASGEGYGSAILSQTASSVVGVDIDISSIEFAQQKYQYQSNLKFLVGGCDSIPLVSESIDVVVSFETIEHHDKHEEMMKEIKRVIKNDGILIISSPNRLVYSDFPNYHNHFHVKELYYDEFTELLNKYFSCTKIYGQRMATGSFIYSLHESNLQSFNCYSGDSQLISKQFFPLYNPVYFIAVCSNNYAITKDIVLDSLYLDRKDDLFNHGSAPKNNQWSETNKYTINTTIISCSQDDPEALWGFNLEQAAQVNTSNTVELMLKGWVLGKKSKVEVIEIIHNHVVVKQTFVDFRRIDVAEAYSHVPDADMSGFETIVNIGELVAEGELLIQAVCADKSCVPLSKIQFHVG
ncbi:MAG: methyltransferase domain-containing protein [Limnospira sp. PMC 1238.20]|nr:MULTISPECIES: methyltransferase domain-containing protein [unclassified Limnospira]MDT9179479.1 methyltransferase domain-containing protein [Limnospira sp. PMC 1238.20]MDT9229428.1 methyltransferase domain-containing protein [Limnospira sp. PMC 1242.20]MDT9245944.1 methyltransferase domain-containing protein [Limnospira sp. PMC 1249.20]